MKILDIFKKQKPVEKAVVTEQVDVGETMVTIKFDPAIEEQDFTIVVSGEVFPTVYTRNTIISSTDKVKNTLERMMNEGFFYRGEVFGQNNVAIPVNRILKIEMVTREKLVEVEVEQN